MHDFAGDIIDEHARTSQPENTKDSVAVDQHHVALFLTNTGPVWTEIWQISGYDVKCSGHEQSSLMPNSFYQRHKIPLRYKDIKLRAYVINLNPVVIDNDTDADVTIDIEPVADQGTPDAAPTTAPTTAPPFLPDPSLDTESHYF